MRTLFIITIYVFCSFAGNGQTITTICGNGTVSNTGDSGAASAATINLPGIPIFDKYGNLYISTSSPGRTIRKISTSGIITTIAGTGVSGYSGDGGLAITASFMMPGYLAFDTAGNLFVTDLQAHVVRRIDMASGIITTYAGTGVAGFSGDGGPATLAQLKDPGGIAIDKHNNLFVVDRTNNRIRKVDPVTGIITTYAGNGMGGFGGDGGPVSSAAISVSATDQISFDDSGNLFIPTNTRIRKVSPSGIITTIAGTGVAGSTGEGGAATVAQVQARCIAVDRFRNIYFHASSNNAIWRVNSSGILNRVAGASGSCGYSGDGGPALDAVFCLPAGIATDSCGNLIVCDNGNYRVRKIAFDICSTIGVNEVATINEVSVVPNPAYDEVTITAGTTLHSITLCNMAGQVVYTTTPTSKTTTIGISHLPAGIYILRADGVVKRVVKG